MYEYLNSINSPEDLKSLSRDKLDILCKEIRDFLINNVSKTGGHLASNLGVVELTVALHKVFTSPIDSIVFDVGHQAYVHKMLTGRLQKFDTLRQFEGLSGFTNPKESEHDAFISGHSSISISAALGMASAKMLTGDNSNTIAVIGDGALTGGEAFEALNNAAKKKTKAIIILNDNEMSISKNVGGIAKYLSSIRNTSTYYGVKFASRSFLNRIPLIGKPLIKFFEWTKHSIKRVILKKDNLFEQFGCVYLGPVDGHNLKQLIALLTISKKYNQPVVIHVKTVKGKGYPEAEINPNLYHGVSANGCAYNGSFSEAFGQSLCAYAENDSRICAVTAAMSDGCGISEFAKKFPKRFFDVGIAEQHATTFSAGLAKKGIVPVFSVYSSFLQRAYDQILHDVCIQNIKVVFAVDRAGIVGEDGETHQGIFDMAFLNNMPNMTVLCPRDYEQLDIMLYQAIYEIKGPVCIRYPRGQETVNRIHYNKTEFNMFKDDKNQAVAVAYGRASDWVIEALKDSDVDIMLLNKVKPIAPEVYSKLNLYKKIFVFEECIKNGSIAQVIASEAKAKVYVKAIEDFVPHGSLHKLLEYLKLTPDDIRNFVLENTDE